MREPGASETGVELGINTHILSVSTPAPLSSIACGPQLGLTHDIALATSTNLMINTQEDSTELADPGWELGVRKSAVFLAFAMSAQFLSGTARSGDLPAADGRDITIEQASQMLGYRGGNDRMRVELAPSYSAELGPSLKAAAGGYLNDEIALGLIVEFGENKREYLGNAGIQLNESLALLGTVGMLEEDSARVRAEGRTPVKQMEYGASLRGDYEAGPFNGFELNGYLVNAGADDASVQTGRLYGLQVLTGLDLTSTTHIKLGGGYEWLGWDDGGDRGGLAFSAEGTHQLGEALSINANASVGASQNIYGAGFAIDISHDVSNANMIGLNYAIIDGKNGVEDDRRVELSWSHRIGARPAQSASAGAQETGKVRSSAAAPSAQPANGLLGDVMRRPHYLPASVLAKVTAEKCTVDNYLLFVSDPGTAPVPFTVLQVGAYASAGDDDIEVRDSMGVGTFDIYKQVAPDNFQLAFTDVTLALEHNNVPGAYNALKTRDAFAFAGIGGSCYALTWYNNW